MNNRKPSRVEVFFTLLLLGCVLALGVVGVPL